MSMALRVVERLTLSLLLALPAVERLTVWWLALPGEKDDAPVAKRIMRITVVGMNVGLWWGVGAHGVGTYLGHDERRTQVSLGNDTGAHCGDALPVKSRRNSFPAQEGASIG